MKKLTALIAVLLLACTFVFADVAVKDLGDGTAEVRFFYGNPRASEVVIAGSWTDWEKAPLPMTKVDGGWEYVGIFSHDDELKYKFISDGNWTPDIKAPDSVDDGFGGKNGLVEVGTLVAIEAAKASGDTSALDALAASKSGLRFGTFTQLNLTSTMLTRSVVDPAKKGFEVDDVQFRAKSYWKLSGEILPKTPVYLEIQAFDGTKDLYRVSNDGVAKYGFDEFATGIFFNPFNYILGGNPVMGHFKAGVNTDYVNIETAYNWAKPSKREGIIWTTVKDSDSNAGYLQLTNGAAVQNFGDIKLDLGIAPNKSLGSLAMRSWLGLAYSDLVTVDVQWDVKSNSPEGTISKFFNDFDGDIIIGAKGNYAGAELKAQFLLPASKEEVKDAVAYAVKASYGMDAFGVGLGLHNAQANASMMYGDNDGIDQNQTAIYLNPWGKFSAFKVGANVTLWTTQDFKFGDKLDFAINPYANVNFADLDVLNGEFDIYAKMDLYALKEEDAFNFYELGAKFSMNDVSDPVPSFAVLAALRMEEVKNYLSLIGTLDTSIGIGVELGTGLRLLTDKATDPDKDANELFGFFLGANYKVKALKDGKFYGAFVFNMDPYEDDKDGLKLDGHRVDKDIDDFAGKAKFRLGMIWDF